MQVTTTYTTGGVGTGQLTLQANGTASDAGSFTVPIVSMSVAVTPDGGTTGVRTIGWSGSDTFSVENTGGASGSYNMSCQGTGVECLGVNPASAVIASNQTISVVVNYRINAQSVAVLSDGSSGLLRLTATWADGSATDNGWFNVPLARVAVTWDSTEVSRNAMSGPFVDTVDVINRGSVSDTFNLSCTGLSVVCSVSSSSAILSPGGSARVAAVFSTEAPGPVDLLFAASGHSSSGSGTMQLNITTVQVQPEPPIMAVIWPPAQTRINSTLRVVIDWCAYAPYILDENSTRIIRHNGVDVTQQFTFYWDFYNSCRAEENPANDYGYRSVGVIQLTEGANTIEGRVTATGGGAEDLSVVTYTLMGSGSGTPDVQVTAPAQYAEERTGSGRMRSFTVANTGGASGSFTLGAVCSGTGVSACSISSQNPITVGAGSSTTATISYTAGSVGTSGRIWLTASVPAGGGTRRDSAFTDIGVTAAPPTGVALVQTTDVLERDLCVTIAAGDGAAYECGDLRLAHDAPVTRTRGTTRGPVLIYNSQHAQPYPLVRAEVTLPVVPDSVTARLLINGAQRATGKWPGSNWQLGWASRIAIGLPLDTTTGAVTYTLEVRRWTGSTSTLVGSPTGQLLIVNRRTGVFGAGWWVAGVEQLIPLTGNAWLWVGGDGSVRRYANVATNVWAAPRVDRPDTLKWNAGLARYVRYLRNGLQVRFNSAGRHVETVTRLSDTTRLTYDGSNRLATMVLPPSTSTRTYTFVYNASSGKLDSIIAPAIGTTKRATRITMTSGRITTIRDPDLTTVSFAYGAGADVDRVIRRTNRRSYTTRFAYDAAKRLSTDSIELAAGTWAITAFAAAEARAFATTGVPGVAWRSDTVYTQLDGPRADVSDVTRFWPNAYGAPLRIRNALGDETRVVYDATWPALATRTIAANGFETQAIYHPTRGLPTTVTAVDPRGPGTGNAITTYLWHNTWDMAVRSVSPTGLLDTFAYDAATGNRLWQARGNQTAAFTYYPAGTPSRSGLLATVSVAGMPPESLVYNGLGNLSRTRTPIGFTTVVYSDAIGRDTLVFSPRDSVKGRDSLSVVQHGSRARTRYDIMDRVIESISWGPADTVPATARFIPADSVRIVNLYDPEGNDTATTRYVPRPTGQLSLRNTWAFDRANRTTSEYSVGISSRFYTYDAAGNVLTTATGRGYTITATYDALNRVRQRIVPQVAYSPVDCNEFYVADCYFGTFPTREGSVCLRSDTTTFAYDRTGNIVRADNWAARVRRGYTPAGQLSRDTLAVRTYYGASGQPCEPMQGGGEQVAVGFTQHVYPLRFEYDLEGRRTRLYHPDAVDPCVGECSQRYHYNATTGVLDSLVDVLGYAHRFTYDAAGRQRTRTAPGAWVDSTVYDNDSRATRRKIGSYAAEQLRYDAAGRVDSASVPGYAVAARLVYSGLGALAYAAGLTQQTSYEEFWTDAIGNRTLQSLYDGGTIYPVRRRALNFDAVGRHTFVHDTLPAPGDDAFLYEYQTAYDASGNVDRNWGREDPGYQGSTTIEWARLSYFSADEKLRVFNNRATNDFGVYEEYRYDALGRRVLVRTRDTGGCAAPHTSQCGHIERTVWDGDQVLYEIRARGGDSATSAQLENDADVGITTVGNRWGRVAYQHAGGIDVPLGVIRMNMDGQPNPLAVSPHTNWQGDFEVGSWMDGSATNTCEQQGCPQIPFPGGRLFADGGAVAGSVWFGNLITGQLDGSGLQYMRNRYYDPSTGRFTQQDPIGLAGGLNLYGFAGGDPVNYDDPFGDSLRTIKVMQRSTENPTQKPRELCIDQHVQTNVQAINDEAVAAGLPVVFNNAYRDRLTAGQGGRPTGGKRSLHLSGFAFDIRSAAMTVQQLQSFTGIAAVHGFQPIRNDPGHYQFRGGDAVYGSHRSAIAEAARSYAAGECRDANVDQLNHK